jgi:hypothetical protein
MHTLLRTALALCVVGGTAVAEPDEPRAETTTTTSSWRPRLEGGIGFRWGSYLVNNIDASDGVRQVHLDGGIRLFEHRAFLYLQYALQSMTIPVDDLAERSMTPAIIGNGNGLMHRFGAHARYDFGRLGDEDGGLDLFADLGAGVQHVRWDAGGAWTRPDLAMSLGLTGFGIGDEQHGGLTFALVLAIAPRNDLDGAQMACGGPCDYATTPTGVDRSFMFDITLNFGK